MMQFFDVETIRARLVDTDVPADVGMAYLAVLTNLNALSHLLSPNVDLEDEAGTAELERLFREHQQRKSHLEAKYPDLAVASRTSGWAGH